MSKFEYRVSEPKLKDGVWERGVRLGGKVYGHIRREVTKPGEPKAPPIYWAKRNHSQYQLPNAGWAIAPGLVVALRPFGVQKFAICLDDGTEYLTPMSSFLEEGRAQGAELKEIRPSLKLWHIPAHLWEVRLPPEEDRVLFTLKKMRVATRGVRGVQASDVNMIIFDEIGAT